MDNNYPFNAWVKNTVERQALLRVARKALGYRKMIRAQRRLGGDWSMVIKYEDSLSEYLKEVEHLL